MEHFLYADDKEVEDMLCYKDYIVITDVHESDAFSDNYMRNKEDSVIGMIGIFKPDPYGSLYKGWRCGDFIHDKDIKRMESLNENWNYDIEAYCFNGIKFKYIYR